MAKKAVASLQTGKRNWVKVIKSVRSPKTGAVTFKTEMVEVDKVQDHLAS